MRLMWLELPFLGLLELETTQRNPHYCDREHVAVMYTCLPVKGKAGAVSSLGMECIYNHRDQWQCVK